MATRGNIVFITGYEENYDEKLQKEQVYIHWDMYPEYTLEWLKDFLQLEGAINRKNDDNYLTAWLVYYYLSVVSRKTLDDEDFSGIGIENEPNEWGEYTYIVEPINEDNKNFKIEVLGSNFEKYEEHKI